MTKEYVVVTFLAVLEMARKNEINIRQENNFDDIIEINKTLPGFKKIKELIITTEPLEKTTTQKIKRFKEFEKILGK